MAANKILAENNLLLSQRVASYASEINRLKALVVKLQRMQFGQSSEKMQQKAERQIHEAQERISHLQEEMTDILGEQPDPALPPALRQPSSRKPLPATQPCEIQTISPAEKTVQNAVGNCTRWAVIFLNNWRSSAAPLKLSKPNAPSLPTASVSA